MKFFYLVLFLIFLFATNVSKIKKKSFNKDEIKWNSLNLINTINKFDNYIDPENILLKYNKTEIDESLSRLVNSSKIDATLKPIIPVIIFVSEISDEYIYKSSKGIERKNTKLFLLELSQFVLKKLSIEDDHCMFILFSINDKQVNIRIGQLFKHFFSRGLPKKEILDSIHGDLLENKYTEACIKIIEQIRYFMEEDIIDFSYIIIIIFIPVILYILISSCLSKKKLIKSKNHTEKEEIFNFKVLPVEEILKHFEKLNKSNHTTSQLFQEICFYCLDPYDGSDLGLNNLENQENEILITENLEHKACIKLQCGHILHYECYNYFQKKCLNICHYCKFNNENQQNKTNYLTALLEVQTKLNKDLQAYDCEIADGKITWQVPEIEEEIPKMENIQLRLTPKKQSSENKKFKIRDL